ADGTPPRRGQAPSRALPLARVLREDLGWLLAPAQPGSATVMAAAAQAVLGFLEHHGASFVGDIARGTALLPAQVEDALWTLVARGLVTGDGMAALRALLAGPERRRRRRLAAIRAGRPRLVAAGRWSLLRRVAEEGAGDAGAMRLARRLLRRCGVVTRGLTARE